MARSYSERTDCGTAELLSDLANGRLLHARAVGEKADRQSRIVDALEAELLTGLLVVTELDPLERYAASLEIIANGLSGGTAALAVEADWAGLLHGTPFA
jgi:hypothetical protein